ncbi:MAG: PIN domain-containing protein [Acetobacteraceae bacterium]|nr:PIN domain-containing protein [Acetobacteraceae bacterium]
MIVLDTNVLSEAMRPAPHRAFADWFYAQPRASLWTTCVSEAEMRAGAAHMPAGRRRDDLVAVIDRFFGVLLAGRVLPFERDAAARYAEFVAYRRRIGRPLQIADAMIAATAMAAGAAAFATRNTRDFEGLGLALVDPWGDAGA